MLSTSLALSPESALESQLAAAFRTGFLKASWSTDPGASALTQSETGHAIARLTALAAECPEPVAFRVRELAGQLTSAFLEGFALSKGGAAYEGAWAASSSRKALYMEPPEGQKGLAPGNTPKAGERWHVVRDGGSACQTVDVLDVTQHTALVRPVGATRDERLALDATRFLERPAGGRGLASQAELLNRYAKNVDFNNADKVVAEARRLVGAMEDGLSKCVFQVLVEMAECQRGVAPSA